MVTVKRVTSGQGSVGVQGCAHTTAVKSCSSDRCLVSAQCVPDVGGQAGVEWSVLKQVTVGSGQRIQGLCSGIKSTGVKQMSGCPKSNRSEMGVECSVVTQGSDGCHSACSNG